MTNVDAPDWSGFPSIGSGQLLGGKVGLIGPGQSLDTGALDCGGYEAVVVRVFQAGDQSLSCLVEWVATGPGGGFTALGTTFRKDTTVSNLVPFAVQGPNVDVSVTNEEAVANATPTIAVYGVARTGDAPIIPSGVRIQQNNVAINAGQTLNPSPDICVPGRYHFWGLCAQTCAFGVQYWNGAAWVPIVRNDPGANVSNNIPLIVPADEWRMSITNTSGVNSTLQFAVVGPV